MLFGHEQEKSDKADTAAAYETVDEAMTTDTTDIQSEQEERAPN